MAKNTNKQVKNNGVVFTPDFMVKSILDEIGYSGPNILQKKIIEPSFGEGAFSKEIVYRYCTEFLNKYGDDTKQLCILKQELEENIYGIELNQSFVDCTVKLLNQLVEQFGIQNVKWKNLKCDSTLNCFHNYKDSMDFVVGNPPYVRIHNLDEASRTILTSMKFTQEGMTDLYLSFFEMGFLMLKNNGTLGYITPSSYLNSNAGQQLREYMLEESMITKLLDLQHHQIFVDQKGKSVTAYTCVTVCSKSNQSDSFDYYTYEPEHKQFVFQSTLTKSIVWQNNNILLHKDPQYLLDVKKINTMDHKNHPSITVKNGFATNKDSVFILPANHELAKCNLVIDIIKGSTGEWKRGIYPYKENGEPLTYDEVCAQSPEVAEHLNANKESLLKRSIDNPISTWHLYGRTQALQDTHKSKVSINTMCRNKDDLKIHLVKEGSGVYSGLYILSPFTLTEIRSILQSDHFVDYVKTFNNFKSGGYYTFKSSTIAKYLIYCMSNDKLIKPYIASMQQVAKHGTRSSKVTDEMNRHTIRFLEDYFPKPTYQITTEEKIKCARGDSFKIDIIIRKNGKHFLYVLLKGIRSSYNKNRHNYANTTIGETQRVFGLPLSGDPRENVHALWLDWIPNDVPLYDNNGELRYETPNPPDLSRFEQEQNTLLSLRRCSLQFCKIRFDFDFQNLSGSNVVGFKKLDSYLRSLQ